MANEERFSREKQHRGFPFLSIREALSYCNLDYKDIDLVACGGWSNPDLQVIKDYFASTGSLQLDSSSKRLYHSLMSDKPYREELLKEVSLLFPDTSKFYDHHLSHAAAAFYCTGLDEADVLHELSRDLQSAVV